VSNEPLAAFELKLAVELLLAIVANETPEVVPTR
jgi:hypothetical protein